MAPKNPNKVARQMKEKLGNEFIVLDANDLNVDILGKSSKSLDEKFLKALFKDNPLGQSSQQTPIAIVRKKNWELRIENREPKVFEPLCEKIENKL